MKTYSAGLRRYSKFVVGCTLFLIFAGSLVTSTGSALAVPDWPLAYGMLFPPMVGGVLYEHGHRLIAATVGSLTLVLTAWILISEKRKLPRRLGVAAIFTIIGQGLLGGLTVIFLLPKPVSISHAVLGQTFFLLTISIAHLLSRERSSGATSRHDETVSRYAAALTAVVYIQLILGALMRHTASGLAIPDFPTMAGSWFPHFNSNMLTQINSVRFDLNLPPATLTQVVIHFVHRAWALVVVLFALRFFRVVPPVWRRSAFAIAGLLLTQIALGAFTVWTHKLPFVASFHVVTGAALMGLCALTALRSAQLKSLEPVSHFNTAANL